MSKRFSSLYANLIASPVFNGIILSLPRGEIANLFVVYEKDNNPFKCKFTIYRYCYDATSKLVNVETEMLKNRIWLQFVREGFTYVPDAIYDTLPDHRAPVSIDPNKPIASWVTTASAFDCFN